MDENTQREFIKWLGNELKVESEQELEDKLKQLGDEGIKKAYQMFTKQKTQTVSIKENGGALEYLKCLQSLKKGGKMKASCGCSGAVLAKTGAILDKGKDSKSAVGGRNESGKKEHTANIGNDPKGKDGKSAVGKTKFIKSKDDKTALNRRFEQGKKEHTARVNMKGAGGAIIDSDVKFKPTKKLNSLNPKRVIKGLS